MLRIEGPERVHWDLSRSLKIQCHGASSTQGCLLLTAVRLETGTVSCGEPVFDETSVAIDVRRSLNIPWKDSSVLLTLLAGNQHSNRLHVRLEPSELAFRDPEVEKFVATHRHRGRPLPVWPESGENVHYRRRPESPEVPDKEGIALKVRKTTVHGSFRLRVLPADVVSATERKTASRFAYLSVNAVVPITLIVLGRGAAEFIPFQLHVPSYSEIDPGAKDPPANGFFSLNLSEWTGQTIPPNPFIYAFSGSAFTAPAKSNIL